MKFHSGLPAIAMFIASPSLVWAAAETAPGAGGHGELVLIVELGLFLLIGRGLGEILQRLGQPAVIGALLAGLILGPSLFGWLWPDAFHHVFPDDRATRNLISGIADVGVLLLLMLTGMEMDLRLVRRVGRPAVAVSICGIAVPFACGFALGQFLPDALLADPARRLVASLFLGTALSISSIKIVAMVVRDIDFMRRDLGQIIVASAILEDTAGWIIISLVLGVAGAGEFSPAVLVRSLLGTIGFLAISYTAGRPLVFRLIRLANDHCASEYMVITVILLVMLSMALITQLIGVNTVLGAFTAGVLIGESPILTGEISARLQGFITAFLTPVFFGISGLGADLTILRDPRLLALTVALVLIASVGKFAGTFLGGIIGRRHWREALALGCGMNARGSTEVIVASIGLSAGALSRDIYTMVLGMAVLTTMAMPPMLRWALAHVPADAAEEERLRKEAIDAEGFVSRFERVLVAADESPSGAFATRLAGFLAGQRGLPITVLTLTPGNDKAPARQLAEAARESAKLSAGLTETGRERHAKGNVEVIARVESDAAAGAVAAEAKKGFDLLFIGLSEMTAPDGGFSERVNQLAAGFEGPVALAIGAAGVHFDHERPATVLIPVNGTAVSRGGAELAFAIVPPSDARCIAVHAAELPMPAGTPDPPRGAATPAEQAVLEDIIALGARHGFKVKTAVYRHVEPAEAIPREAATRRANFLVIGASRRVGETLMLGKTVDRLLKEWRGNLVVLAN